MLGPFLDDDVACNTSLALRYGASKGALAPTTLSIELWHGDPALPGSAELGPDGGYVPLEVPNDATTWPDAPDGRAITSADLEWPAATGEYSDTATYFLIRDLDTGAAWDSGRLADEVSITQADQQVKGPITVFYTGVG
jgi:hypothetical protein